MKRTLYLQGSILSQTTTKNKPRMTTHASEVKHAEQMSEKELRKELKYLRAENAVAKNFFGILKTEVFHNEAFKNVDDKSKSSSIITTTNELS